MLPLRPCQEHLRLEISKDKSRTIPSCSWDGNLLARSEFPVSSVLNDTTDHRKASRNDTRATTLHCERTEAEHQEYPASSYTACLPAIALLILRGTPRLEHR